MLVLPLQKIMGNHYSRREIEKMVETINIHELQEIVPAILSLNLLFHVSSRIPELFSWRPGKRWDPWCHPLEPAAARTQRWSWVKQGKIQLQAMPKNRWRIQYRNDQCGSSGAQCLKMLQPFASWCPSHWLKFNLFNGIRDHTKRGVGPSLSVMNYQTDSSKVFMVKTVFIICGKWSLIFQGRYLWE